MPTLSSPSPNNFSPVQRLNLNGVGVIASGNPSAPALICLHGWGGSRDIWKRFLERFGPSHYVVSLDLPGTQDTVTLGSWTMEAVTRWVLDVADRLGIGSFALMGHSMGGNIAAHVAKAAPERVKQLVLVDAAIYADRLDLPKHYLAPGYGRALLYAACISSAMAGLLSHVGGESERGGVLRPWFRRCVYFAHHNRPREMTEQLKCMVSFPFDPAAFPPNTSILMIHGHKDTVVPVAQAQEAAREIEKSRKGSSAAKLHVSIHPNATHCPMDSDPIAFMADVRGFLC